MLIKSCILIVFFFAAFAVPAQVSFPTPDIQKTETHSGNLTIEGIDVWVIENTHFKIDGSIEVKDSAQFIIRQSIIELLGDPGDGQVVAVHDQAKMTADTTIFGGFDASEIIDPADAESLKAGDIIADGSAQVVLNNCFSLTQTFLGKAKVLVRNSYFWKEPLGIVHVEGNAEVVFEDSYIGAIYIEVPNQVPVTIDSLVPGYIEYWSAKENISEQLTYDIILRRTEVMENKKGYQGGMEMGWNISVDALATDITISHSKLNKLIINFPDAEPAFLSDLVLRSPTNFNLNNIHLINTEIQTQWGVFMNGGSAEITNSEGLFIFMTGGDGDVIVHHSEVGEIDPRKYNGRLIFEESTWLGGYEIFENSHIRVEGSVRLMGTVPIFDETSSLTRTYDIVIRDDLTSAPFGPLNLSLSKNGSEVWQGMTDAEGEASFDVVFNKMNFEDEWILTTDAADIQLRKPISIYISNPVHINLALEEDGLSYRPVLHVAPGHPFFPTGSRESPYPAIQEAIQNSGGDIIYVHPGNYDGAIEPGGVRGRIFLKDSVIVIGAGADSTSLRGQVNSESASGAQIKGFHIEDGIRAVNSSVSISNVVIDNFSGIAIWGSHTNFELINNSLINNSQDGVFLHDSSTALIKNNIISGNTGFGISGVESSSAVINYNNVWNNGTDYHEFLPSGDHDISLEPLFINEFTGDFHLQAESPCIDAGDPDVKYNDSDGSRNDLGAFGGIYSSSVITSTDEKSRPGLDALQFAVRPNPFTDQIQISFLLSENRWIDLSLYDSYGRKIHTLMNDHQYAGEYHLSWDGRRASGVSKAGGMYFLQLLTHEEIRTQKILLMK